MREDLQQHFMERALLQADVAAANGEVPVGSVVVHNSTIIGEGYNRREELQDPTAHAELIAIRKAAETLGTWRLEGCTVFVTLEPCSMCAGAMVLARIERCVYGCTDPKGGFLGTLANLSQHQQLNHRFEVVPGVMADACSQRLSGFFRELRKKK